MRLFLLVTLLLPLLTAAQTAAQPHVYPFAVARDRMLWHDNVDKEQRKLLNTSGTVQLTRDESINLQIEDALIRRLDQFQEKLELDSVLTGNDKKKYLKALELMLRGFNQSWNKKDHSASQAPAVFNAFLTAMKLDQERKSIEPVIIANEYGVGKIIVDCFLYPTPNPGIEPSRIHLLEKYLALHPNEILPVLSRNPDLRSADSLIALAAHDNPRKLYDYAAGSNRLASRIRNHNDNLVKTVARMANNRSGQLYFPFLDNILKGNLTFEQIDKVKENDFEYYRLLVKTRVDYARRLLPPMKDTAWEMSALTDMLARKAKDNFIREINGLHAVEDENVRFRKLDGFTPQELYYLIVLGEDEIYTSSYLGVYKRIFQRMPNPSSGDTLLMSVNADYFRKFIKMAAGYNTLNDFLGRMSKENATTLMKAFIIGLERTKGLEDAVDVADSYSSIMDKNPELAAQVLQEVEWNYKRNVDDNNQRGKVIYNLLKTLFESTDSTRKIDLSATLGIPPVYTVDYKALCDDSGRVIQQVFFYGDEDKDGQLSYANFMGMFRGRSDWKIAENPHWVTITSTKGKPVVIFANKPLYGPDDPDARAQAKLNEYLYEQQLKPTVVIHRGHSYHLKYTLNQLATSARIVVLGSCGGYNNLNDVLTISEDAHIISSKQVGTKTVNEPILQAINTTLVNGRNVDWIGMWRELGERFQNEAAAKEKFDDYIPPYKNLGAIFIKAYRRAMETGQ
ncbi:MAG TPA: hypothetical protein VD993_12505 [Chitinophagaceae bacterium]|nr:hypothetical protein [Chitinophagaceae bacterium]